MADLPEHLDRGAHIDLHGRNVEPWFRRAAAALLLGVCCLGLANVFGQHTRSTTVHSPAASLTVESAGRVRGGLIYQAIFRVEAHRDLRNAVLALDPGWFDGLTINTVEPDSVTWSQEAGRNTMALGPIKAGDRFVLRLQYQVNPTVLGHRSQKVILSDGGISLLAMDRAQTVFP